jgi:hypothetical protein
MRYARKYFDVDAGADRATFVSFGWFSQYCRYGILPTLSARQVQLLNVAVLHDILYMSPLEYILEVLPRRPWISGSRNGHDIHASTSLQKKYAPSSLPYLRSYPTARSSCPGEYSISLRNIY